MTYRISTVAEMTGIPRNTLIAWERRYGLLNPERQDNGYRRYTEEDVAQLLRLKNALNAGLKISEAISLVLGGETRAFSPDEPSIEAAAKSLQRSPFEDLRNELFDALASYRGDEAQRVLARTLTIPFETRLHQIYFPLLRLVGEKWVEGKLSVAQEHYASGIIKAHLATVFINTAHFSIHAPHAACTTLPHDEHEIAALALSIQLSMKGHRVSYLGAKLPLLDLVGFCEKQKPKLLCISCIAVPQHDEFKEYLGALSAVADQGTRVVLGGQCLTGIVHPSRCEIIPNWSDFHI